MLLSLQLSDMITLGLLSLPGPNCIPQIPGPTQLPPKADADLSGNPCRSMVHVKQNN